MKKQTRYQLLSLLDQYYHHWTGQKLSVPLDMEEERLIWLDEQSPYGLLVQNIDAAPLFIYANKKAQLIFDYTLEEFLLLTSSQSAPPSVQKSRNQLLQEVAIKGLLNDFQGIRLDRHGKIFEITHGSIWKVLNDSGENIGIAAMIWSDHPSEKKELEEGGIKLSEK